MTVIDLIKLIGKSAEVTIATSTHHKGCRIEIEKNIDGTVYKSLKYFTETEMQLANSDTITSAIKGLNESLNKMAE